MKFKLDYSSQAKKFLKRLDKKIAKRILEKIELLLSNLVPSDAKFIRRENNEKIFRIRIGKYRVLYKIKETKEAILVSKIDKRERIY